MPIAAAVPAIIGVAGSIGGSLIGSAASKSAANQIAAGQQKVQDITNQAVQTGQAGVNAGVANANQTLSTGLTQDQAAFQPYIGAGTTSLGDLRALATSGNLTNQFSFNQSNLDNDPGYQFTLQQGQQAIQRAAAAQGGLFSSGTLKSLGGYTTGTANQYFNDAYNRSLSTFNTNRQGALAQAGILQNLAGMGSTATQGLVNSTNQLTGAQAQNTYGGAQYNAGLGLQGADIVGRSITGQTQAQAAGTVGQANAWAQGIGGATNAIGGFLAQRNLANMGGAPTQATRPFTLPNTAPNPFSSGIPTPNMPTSPVYSGPGANIYQPGP